MVIQHNISGSKTLQIENPLQQRAWLSSPYPSPCINPASMAAVIRTRTVFSLCLYWGFYCSSSEIQTESSSPQGGLFQTEVNPRWPGTDVSNVEHRSHFSGHDSNWINEFWSVCMGARPLSYGYREIAGFDVWEIYPRTGKIDSVYYSGPKMDVALNILADMMAVRPRR